jgi:hypothetical protein
MHLTEDQRGRIGEKLMEWGNLLFVGLVIGQLVPGINKLQLGLMMFGVAGMAGAYATAYFLMKGGGQ